jgi:hypothetical protein
MDRHEDRHEKSWSEWFRPLTRQLRRGVARQQARRARASTRALGPEGLEQRSMMAVFLANPAAPDIVGFNPALDSIDFGDVSVHNLIVGKTESGEAAVVSPWAWTPEYQVIRGTTLRDLAIKNFGVVQNEHLRQDLGGVVSWEQGVGPRDANTVYVRSHEYGKQERVVGFDPAVNKLSMLYFGTRERLTVSDTAEGLLISVEPTKQSVLLVGVKKSALVAANIEFHHDQIIEDQLEVPFGFTAEQVTMVSRAALLTPLAPAGQPTDGSQTQAGSSQLPTDGCCGVCGEMDCTHDHGDTHDDGAMHDHDTAPMPVGEKMPASGVFTVTWAWAENRTFGDFDPATDVLALDWFSGSELQLTEVQGSAVLKIPAMQQSYTLSGVSLARLGAANFTCKDTSATKYISGVLAAADAAPTPTPDSSTDSSTDSRSHPNAHTPRCPDRHRAIHGHERLGQWL